MNEDEVRLLQLEGQVHALAQAWLLLAATLEMRELSDPQSLEQALLAQHWQGAAFEPHAQSTARYLVEQLGEARERRQQRDSYRSTGPDG